MVIVKSFSKEILFGVDWLDKISIPYPNIFPFSITVMELLFDLKLCFLATGLFSSG